MARGAQFATPASRCVGGAVRGLIWQLCLTVVGIGENKFLWLSVCMRAGAPAILCVGVSREILHFGRSKHSFLLTRFCPRVGPPGVVCPG